MKDPKHHFITKAIKRLRIYLTKRKRLMAQAQDLQRQLAEAWRDKAQLEEELADNRNGWAVCAEGYRQLEEKNEGLREVLKASYSLEMLLDALGARHSLRDAGPDLESLSEALNPFREELEALLKGGECEHPNAVSAINEVIKSGMYCPDCKCLFAGGDDETK